MYQALCSIQGWEMHELEWQDERDHHLKQLENPTPQINAQLSQADKRSKFEVLHIKAQTRAEGTLRQLKLIKDNLASSLSNQAFATIKEQIGSSEADIDHTL